MAEPFLSGWRPVLAAALTLLPPGLVVASPQSPAQQAPDTQPDERVAPEAQRTLDRVRAHYAGLTGLGVTARLNRVNIVDGQEVMREVQSLAVLAARPARVASRSVGGIAPEYTLVCDGRTLSQSVGTPWEKYVSAEAPGGFGAIIDAASLDPGLGTMLMAEPDLLVLALLDGRRFDDLCAAAARIQYVGREDAGGQPRDRIRITGEKFGADLWVRAEGEAWVVRIVPEGQKLWNTTDERILAGMPGREILFADWESRNEFTDSAFTFTPPEGAEKVASLVDAIQDEEAAAAEREAQGEQLLLGKAAPALDLDLLDGGRLSLEAHRGKDVVVLDFWATWCAPCVVGLPIVSKVAAGFKDEGVVFYAVNEGESPPTVRKFLEKKGLKITVALDRQGKAGESYGVQGIPHMVLVGRDGTVQAIHRGVTGDLETELTDQIRSLVANTPR